MSTLTRHSLFGMRSLGFLLLPLSLIGVALGEDLDPASRVARLALVQGQVSIEPAGLEEWAAADINRPLTSGDKLWSDANSRAELSIGSAVVRLGSSTGFSFLNLDDHTAQMQVTAGTVSVHVRSLSDTLEVDTPNVAVSLLGPGDYRVEVNDAGDTTAVKVSGGTAEVTGGGQDFPVHPQQRVTFTGTADVSEDVASLGAPDAFDSWAYDRDRQVLGAQASNYVSPEVIGAEDLDQNGTWQSTPEDGYVWAPNTVAVGWAPYRFGHWVWISPWGWTWVDDASWGFAPFHYGRWATFGGRWCWVPGPRRERPVYAPALVAWVGGAQSGAAVFAGGGVAWFPLGPREVYVPAYPVSQTYVRNINVANTTVSSSYVTNVYNHNVANVHYVNRNAPGAMTAVSQTAFTSAQPVGRNAARLSANETAAATVSATAPAITPARQSVLGAGVSGPGVRRPPAALQNRLVLAKTAPPPAPVPFALQQQAIRANGGRPLGRSEVASMQPLTPAARVRMTAPASGAEPGTGMARAAGSNSAAPPNTALPVKSRPVVDRPQTLAPAPAMTSRPIERPAPPPAPAMTSRPIERPTPPPAPAMTSRPIERPTPPPAPAMSSRPIERPMPAPAPAMSSRPIERPMPAPQELPQREPQRLPQRDRPPASVEQPQIDDRLRANHAPRPAEIQRANPVEPDLNRRLDRPAAAVRPAPVSSPPPVPSPVEVPRAPAPESKAAKPPAHAEKPARPAERSKENN